MNDFSELEKDLKALRPARPSPVLFERIEGAMAENCRAPVSGARPIAQLVLAFYEKRPTDLVSASQQRLRRSFC